MTPRLGANYFLVRNNMKCVKQSFRQVVSKRKKLRYCYLSMMYSKVSGIELFLGKSIPCWRGDVIMLENDIEPKMVVTKELKPPGQHLKPNC